MRSILSLLLLALLPALTACHRAESTDDSGVRVTGDTVTLKNSDDSGIAVATAAPWAGRSIDLTGRVTWDEDHTVRVFSPFSGRVIKVIVESGQHVAAGQTLATLSSPDFGSAQSDFRKAQAALEQARKARERQRDLLTRGLAAAKDAEQAEADYVSAEAEAQRAQARLKVLGHPGGSVDQLYRLTAPIAGVVVERHINPGQELLTDQSGVPLFVVTDPTTLWVQIDAHEGDLATLRVGQTFGLSVADFADHPFEGTLTQIADYVDATSRTIPLRGRVSNADHKLKGDMYVTVSLLQRSTCATAVPAAAVFLIGNQQYVFVATSSGTYRRRVVQTEAESHGMVPIAEGVAVGETVVDRGALYLQQLLITHGPDS
jgi:membrane fusion protein, heavy metal efflux system